MVELLLKFTDLDGKNDSVQVDKEWFVIGRHSECDLCVGDSRLSREHLLIEKIGDTFVVTDRGSSNGSELNGEAFFDRVKLMKGDRLSLGGFAIEVEIVKGGTNETVSPELEIIAGAAPDSTVSPIPGSASTQTSSQTSAGEIPTSYFVIVALMAFGVLAVLGVFVILSIRSTSNIDNSNFVYSIDPEDTPKNRKTPEPGNSPKPGSDSPSNGVITANTGNTVTLPTPSNLPGGDKTEQNAAAFLRKIAQNDPRAFVTGEQAAIISGKIKSVSSSPALIDNIASARKNAAAIKSLAVSKNLKPQFLAVAAITSLGGSRGDVLQTAQKMADTLDKLGTQIGNEFGDDCLIMMAAYDQGDPMKMRNMLQNLATTATESSRTIRTIWYLKKAGKITENEYDFALRFLAIGAITQSPRDFGVNTESLSF